MRTTALVISILLVSGPLALLSQSPDASAAPIYIQGDLAPSDSWSQATSPVHIVGNATLREGNMLNIKEGTEVRFDEGAHLNIEGGILTIAGTMAAPVRFVANSSSAGKGFYEWIHVTNGSTYQANVNVQWAVFETGIKGLYLDGVQGVRIDRTRFINNSEAGIYMASCSNIMVRNCTFDQSGGWGIRAEFSDNLNLVDNIFSGCARSGLSLSNCVYSSLTSSTIDAAASDRGAELLNSDNMLIDGLIIDNAPTGFVLSGSSWNTIDNCALTADGVGMLVDSSADNLFRMNRFMSCGMPLSFSGGPELVRNSFETTNLVEGLPVRWITNGTLDGVPAGAVVLANCPASTVSNLSFPPNGGPVIVLFGGGSVLRDLVLQGSSAGIVVIGSNGILLENVSVSDTPRSALTMLWTEGKGVKGCRFANCHVGMTFTGPMNMSVSAVLLENNGLDASLSGGALVRCLDSTIASVGTDADSRLDEDYTLRVSVRDRNGSGLAGADMQVRHGGMQKYSTPHFGGLSLLSGSSGDFPSLELTAVTHAASNRTETSTDIEVWDGVNAFDRNPRTLRLSAPTAAVFTATEMGFLAGMVRDLAGDPVEKVDLRLDTAQNATTGADGLYRFQPLPPGTYVVNASLDGWGGQQYSGVAVSVGEVTYVNFTLDAAPGSTGELCGIALDGLGAPLEGARAAVDGGPAGFTDASGAFNVTGAPGGWVNFTVSKPGYVDARGTSFVPPNRASRRANVTLWAAPANATGAVSVRVVDEFSGPLQGARVWLDNAVETFQVTPENGTCLFSDVAAGVHRVSASLAGYLGASVNVTVVSGNATDLSLVLSLELAGNGTLSGMVRTAVGAPIPGATVLVEERNLSAVTDSSGHYNLTQVPAGVYNVTASADGYGPQTVEGVVVAGGTVTVQDFVLRRERTFSNRTLGVTVTGEFNGTGRLVIRRAPAPPALPPGRFDRFFEITATGFTCMTGLRITVTGQLFRDSLSGRDLSKFKIRLYTHPGGPWNPGDKWLAVEDSGYDAEGGFFWANVSHFSVFGIGFSPKSTGPTGVTIIALPPWLSPIAVVAIVLLVGVPIGIIVIRVRQPPQGGGKQQAPPPPPQRGANL